MVCRDDDPDWRGSQGVGTLMMLLVVFLLIGAAVIGFLMYSELHRDGQ
jgi:hypothetical protein